MLDIRWCDAEFQKLVIEYDLIELHIKESTGFPHLLRLEGYIGYVCLGVWDEIIIEGAKIHDSHPFIDECTKQMKIRFEGRCLPESGSQSRNMMNYKLLEVTFKDSSTLLVAFSDI